LHCQTQAYERFGGISIIVTADARRSLCHGLSCLAMAAGRLLHPGDA
jgi:hypothetical protein